MRLQVAQSAKAVNFEDGFKVDELWLIPCGYRPDKPGITAPDHRLNMLKLALKDTKNCPGIKINQIEIENGDAIPTFELIQKL